jgi:glycerol-3-phosphate cytidylyltransferase-like family protein
MAKETQTSATISKDEQIGFHKGSVTTLLKEREEMVKVINVVDALLKAHLEALQKLGVNVVAQQPQQAQERSAKRKA